MLRCDRFPASGPFVNALLHNQEITALIRDTEPHERGLFSVDPSIRNGVGTSANKNYGTDQVASRRKTAYNPAPAQSSAVARVLGNDMLRKIRTSNRDSSRGRGVDVEVLLQGAERLCAVYEVPGASDRIAALRKRHEQISTSISCFEDQVSRQQLSMSRFNTVADDEDHTEGGGVGQSILVTDTPQTFTEDDLRAQEEAIKELEAKKRALEARVAGMERDLGGLLR